MSKKKFVIIKLLVQAYVLSYNAGLSVLMFGREMQVSTTF